MIQKNGKHHQCEERSTTKDDISCFFEYRREQKHHVIPSEISFASSKLFSSHRLPKLCSWHTEHNGVMNDHPEVDSVIYYDSDEENQLESMENRFSAISSQVDFPRYPVTRPGTATLSSSRRMRQLSRIATVLILIVMGNIVLRSPYFILSAADQVNIQRVLSKGVILSKKNSVLDNALPPRQP